MADGFDGPQKPIYIFSIMRSQPVSAVQPALLKWARVSAGLSLEDAALMLKREASELAAWEAGESAPTYPQLEKLAYQIYKRPLAVFFLPQPPEETSPQSEFRTLPDTDLRSLARDTRLHLRRAHAFQIGLHELFAGRNPSNRRIWKDLSISQSGGVVAQAQAVRDYLGITLQTQVAWSDDESALRAWRKAIEDSGVFVFKAPFKQKDISGFCLKDNELPVIYLNNSTTKTRQIFSLLHELAHLLLDMSGLSKFDTSYVDRLPVAAQAIERFCNAVAAEILIPSADFAAQTYAFPLEVQQVAEGQFVVLARRYGVSREAILRRFADQERVSASFYESMARRWEQQKRNRTGGNWQSNQGAYLSSRFAREVVGRHYRHQLTLEQAANLLGIKPKSYPRFEEHFLRIADA
jgi:Zn-dependent peptidase ImmA (M78 family)/transcriptional regulator with XRE-family HTH domain